ncbi:MAG: RluA family pseudouridine synthase [bacterium]|nr:RluA family pseudouridine synthase [bacterium]
MQNEEKEFAGHNLPDATEENHTVAEDEGGQRLDAWLADRLGDAASRTQVQKWIEGGHVSTAEGPIARGRRVQPGESYRVNPPEPAPIKLAPVDLELEVLYEDADCAVIRKPAGIAVHPGPGDARVTLAHGILHHFGPVGASESDETASEPEAQKNLPDPTRPGIVHRLDRDTEGLLLIAKHDRARRRLMELFAFREVHKEYLAYATGNLPRTRGRIELALRRHPRERMRMRVDPAGRMAITEFEIENVWSGRRGRKFFRVHLELLTGRTHQIRVHLAHLGAPVVGDELYSRTAAEFKRFGMLLFARRLAFTQPFSGESIDLTLPLPERFARFEAMGENL